MRITAEILKIVYLAVIVFSFLEILRGDIASGVVGFIIAFGLYKFTKFMSWKPRYINAGIKCKCDNPDCAKCLLVNCKDENCPAHSLKKKEEFRERYKNR